MMLNIIKIWKRWKILRFYEFTRAEGYLGSSNSNFIVIVIASSVWILVQWFNGSNKKEELSWDKTKTKTKSRYSPPQPLKKQKPLTSTLTEEEDEQFGNCILRLNTLLAIVLQIVQQNLMFRKLRCEDVRDDEPQSKSMWEFFILVNYHSLFWKETAELSHCTGGLSEALSFIGAMRAVSRWARCSVLNTPCWPVSASVRPDHHQFRAALLRDPRRHLHPRHEHPAAPNPACLGRHHQDRWVQLDKEI